MTEKKLEILSCKKINCNILKLKITDLKDKLGNCKNGFRTQIKSDKRPRPKGRFRMARGSTPRLEVPRPSPLQIQTARDPRDVRIAALFQRGNFSNADTGIVRGGSLPSRVVELPTPA